jgi:hypothetical protein
MLTTEGVADTVRVSPRVSCGRGLCAPIRITCALPDLTAINSVKSTTTAVARMD